MRRYFIKFIFLLPKFKILFYSGVIAAAADNNNCIVGAAYHANVGGVRMLDGDVTDDVEARSLRFVKKYFPFLIPIICL